PTSLTSFPYTTLFRSIEEKIVEETELGQSKGGRKPTMLQINDQQFNMIGIDIGPSKVHSILTDLSGHIIERHTADLAAAISEDRSEEHTSELQSRFDL